MNKTLHRLLSFVVFILLAAEAFAQTGVMTTAAGTGNAGFNGDGIPATSAEINGPYGVTVDAAGNFYFTEWYNHRVRKVNAGTGIITTIAGTGTAFFDGDGGPATSATLNSPEDVAIDSSGNIYIADS